MWTLILQAAVPLVGFILGKINASMEMKQAFLDFVAASAKNGSVSVALHLSYSEQLKKDQDELLKK